MADPRDFRRGTRDDYGGGGPQPMGPPPPVGTNAAAGGTFRDALNNTLGFFRNPFPAIGAALTKAFTVQAAPRNPYYQIKRSDTSMDSVANNIGVPLQTIVQSNNGIKSLPPVGSYIQTGLQGNNLSSNQANLSGVTSYERGRLMSGYAGSSPYRGNALGGTRNQFMGPMGVTQLPNGQVMYSTPAQVQAEVTQVNLLDMMGIAVPKVSFQAAQSQGATPAQMIAAGYTQNFVTGQWVLGSTTPVRGTNGNYAGAPGTRGNRSGTAERDQKGNLIGRHARRRFGENEPAPVYIPPPPEGTNVATSPSTVLGLRLGSG